MQSEFREGISHPFVRPSSVFRIFRCVSAPARRTPAKCEHVTLNYTLLYFCFLSVNRYMQERDGMLCCHTTLEDRFNGPYFDRLYCSCINHNALFITYYLWFSFTFYFCSHHAINPLPNIAIITPQPFNYPST